MSTFQEVCRSGNHLIDQLPRIIANPTNVYSGARLTLKEVEKLVDEFFKKENKK